MTDIFKGKAIAVQDLLDAKEEKARLIKGFLKENKTVVSLSVNMPGSVKNNQAAKVFFNAGIQVCDLYRIASNGKVLDRSSDLISGPRYIVGFDKFTAEEIKKATVSFEEKYPWTRMLDIDVYTKGGKQISREDIGLEPRKCLVCKKDAKICSSSAKHSEESLKKAITKLYKQAFCSLCANLCKNALVFEIGLTPKPGLVDLNNNGSHKDLDYDKLLTCAYYLIPSFEKFTECGQKNKSFASLRKLGLGIEQDFMKFTCGVNTFKGSLFAMSLICYAMGKTDSFDVKTICKTVKALAKPLLDEKDAGARKSAATGFKTVVNYALPLVNKLKKTFSTEQAYCLTLLGIISKTEDTNILRRSDRETLKLAQKKSKAVLMQVIKTKDMSKISELDSWFISKNISPGGSADLLELTYLFDTVSRT